LGRFGVSRIIRWRHATSWLRAACPRCRGAAHDRPPRVVPV